MNVIDITTDNCAPDKQVESTNSKFSCPNEDIYRSKWYIAVYTNIVF